MASTVFSNWKAMDVVAGYGYGAVFSGYVGDDDEKKFIEKKQPRIMSGLFNFFGLYTNHIVKLSGLTVLGTLAVVTYAKYDVKNDRTIMNYAHRFIAVTTLALLVLNRKNNPKVTLVATITAAIELLNAYKKLPQPVARVWTYAPVINSGIILYASDNMAQQAMACYNLYSFASQYLSPDQNNGGQQ